MQSWLIFGSCSQKNSSWEFPCGTLVKDWYCHCCGSGSIPGLGIFACCRCGQKKKKKKKRKKKGRSKWLSIHSLISLFKNFFDYSWFTRFCQFLLYWYHSWFQIQCMENSHLPIIKIYPRFQPLPITPAAFSLVSATILSHAEWCSILLTYHLCPSLCLFRLISMQQPKWFHKVEVRW